MGIREEIREEAGHGGQKNKKKTARLCGDTPGRVCILVKLHDWSDRAIYFYDLIAGTMDHKEKPSQELWDKWRNRGTEISHPQINKDDVAAWVKHAKQEAKRLGLEVAE